MAIFNSFMHESTMEKHITAIEEVWQIRDSLHQNSDNFNEVKQLVDQVIAKLGDGKISVCQKIQGSWQVNEWIKKSNLTKF